MNFLSKIFSFLAKGLLANKFVDLTDSYMLTNQKQLAEFLTELEHRTILLEQGKNYREMKLLTQTATEILQIAVGDWKSFCDGYTCKIGYHNNLVESNVFILKIKERNACPRDWEFRFNNLKRPA